MVPAAQVHHGAPTIEALAAVSVQLELDFGAVSAPGPENGSRGQRTASEPDPPQDGLHALLDAILQCCDCGTALTAGDLGQSRQLCVACRKARSQDLAAERAYRAGLTGKASKCRCLRWSITENGDGPRRCIKCGRRP